MTHIHTPVRDLLGIEHPVVQDGMGPSGTAALAAAVSSAGGLGTASIPGMNVEPEEGSRLLREQVEYIAGHTEKPFAVNVPVGRVSSGEALPVTEAYMSMLCDLKGSGGPLANRLVAVITSAGFPGEYTRRLQDVGLMHIHKVGSVHHAQKAVTNGVDAIIASGYEMGGHAHTVPMHTMVLAPQVIQAVDVPVLVSGGIYDGSGLAAVLAMGGAGVAMGTRFIATEENDWHENYKKKIMEAGEGTDVVASGVYGPARMLHTKALDELAALEESGTVGESDLASWKDARMQLAMRAGDVEDGLVPAGQVASAVNDIARVSELVPSIVDQAGTLLQRASSQVSTTAPAF